MGLHVLKDKMTQIGINGFGRMGRLSFRAVWDSPGVSIVHVNEIKGGPATAAHLLEFDSVHGRWSRPTTVGSDHFTVDGRKVAFTDDSRPNEVPWEANAVDVVLECSGRFITTDALEPYFERGVRKVVVAAPVKRRVR
jgi:glyceraldehyde 3-phosphate dehydrogenase